MWQHPLLPGIGAVLPGQDSADAKGYREDEIRRSLEAARERGKAATRREQPHYSMLLQWPDDDQSYLMTLPEWEGGVFDPVTHGDTYEEGVKNGNGVLAILVGSAQEDGEPPPRRASSPRARAEPAGNGSAPHPIVGGNDEHDCTDPAATE